MVYKATWGLCASEGVVGLLPKGDGSDVASHRVRKRDRMAWRVGAPPRMKAQTSLERPTVARLQDFKDL